MKTSTTRDSAKYVLMNTIVIPAALVTGAITVGVAIFKWWRKKV